ncbi:hypothetical protein HK097_006379 [Rhizophlyctis rosea]|uniref:Uncharacterized protein n=1 Tax=Rhizophlyctis rosea TaxID=64517 RepID=A0AAD5X911_9FUNG|nr:hypothetical protein HK097_006379 [Rhizophlyctis rosea]
MDSAVPPLVAYYTRGEDEDVVGHQPDIRTVVAQKQTTHLQLLTEYNVRHNISVTTMSPSPNYPPAAAVAAEEEHPHHYNLLDLPRTSFFSLAPIRPHTPHIRARRRGRVTITRPTVVVGETTQAAEFDEAVATGGEQAQPAPAQSSPRGRRFRRLRTWFSAAFCCTRKESE